MYFSFVTIYILESINSLYAYVFVVGAIFRQIIILLIIIIILMSKYQPRIFINDPEKIVPNDVVEQFFLTIKTGDIDKIREFTIQNKNKYNLIEKGTKENQSGKSPVHVVLELDDKIADEDIKLQIIKYLDRMGASFDIPDASNIWPIHLATGKQYETIVDFLIKKQVSLDRKDSSNNTPLHYATNGKEIQCPRSTSVKSLVPEQKFDKLPLNKSLEDINKKLIKLLNTTGELNANIIHMINTIMKIPEMYIDDKLQYDLQTEIINIFVETATTTTYPSDVPLNTTDVIIPKTGGMTTQQTKIEQLINRYYSVINDKLLTGLTNSMDISANNGGWGPDTPIGAGAIEPPSNIQRIMKNTTSGMMSDVLNDYVALRNSITTNSTITNDITRITIPNIVNNIDTNFINPLVFCSECPTINYGESVTLTKMFFLLAYGFEKVNYDHSFTTKILKNFKLVDQPLYDQIINNPYELRFYAAGQPRPYWQYNRPGVLFMNTISDRDYYEGIRPVHKTGMINDHVFDTMRTYVDNALNNVAHAYTQPVPPPAPPAYNIDCINNQLRILFTNSDEIPITGIPTRADPHDEYTNGILGRLSLGDLLTSINYAKYAGTFGTLRPQYRKKNFTWFDMMSELIKEIDPIPALTNPFIDYAINQIRTDIQNRNPGISQINLLQTTAADWFNFIGDKNNIRKSIRKISNRRIIPPPQYKIDANNFIVNDIFGSLPIQIPRPTYLPKTPFANANNRTRGGGYNSYTYMEIFRLLNAIQNYLVNGDFQITNYPQIFNQNIMFWDDYVDIIANTPLNIKIENLPENRTIGEHYPEFIFLYRIFITRVQMDIRSIIEKCLGDIIDRAVKDVASTDPDIVTLRDFVTPLDDAHSLYMLLPSEPDLSKFTIDVDDPMADLKARKWVKKKDIMAAFLFLKDSYIEDELWDEVIEPIYSPIIPATTTTYFAYQRLPELRDIIERNAVTLKKYIDPIISNNNFRNTVRQYLGTYKSNEGGPFELKIGGNTIGISNHNIVAQYKISSTKINLLDIFNQILNKLKGSPNNMTEIFYLTELYGHIFVETQQKFFKLRDQIDIINKIISDIIVFINGGAYYYIPQIFLPALIKQVLVVVVQLFNIRKYLEDFNNMKAVSSPLIDISDKYINSIIGLGTEFISFVNGEMNTTYKKLVDIIKYHNEVVDFLNFTSAIELMDSKNQPPPNNLNYRTNKIFTMNLIPIETFPNIFMDVPNFESLLPIVRLYKIPNIVYYDNDLKPPYFDAFGIKGNPAAGNRYNFNTYREVIEYRRSTKTDASQVSNSPAVGNNSQLNIIAVNNGGPDYQITPVGTNYDGEWLDLDIDNAGNPYNPSVITFYNAFIAYANQEYNFEWLDGMPPSIKRSCASHLKIIKQKVIEDTIQFIINNKFDPVGQDPELVKLYEDIRRLGNESTYSNIDDVKIHIIIGKLLDSIINKLLEYSVRQSISTWILGFVTNDNKYRSLVDTINKNIDIIRQKDYLKLALNDIDADAIDELLTSGSKYVDTNVTQIELNPDNIKYVTKQTNKNFVNYLYNINYFSTTGNIGSNDKCYVINPNIASKLITSNTVNSKNSDGDTPLHMAINMTNPELVNLLIIKGANPKSYVNLQGKTPRDLGLESIKQHTMFTDGSTVINTIKNFVEPFNDMLISRVKDEKYGNNIIKNISMGIPIQLIMYNHMFHLYLENYRFNFTIELKTKIKALIKKYIGGDDVIYPIDLLTVNNRKELIEILRPEMPKHRVTPVVNEKNRKKIASSRDELSQLKIQLDGYTKEMSNILDPDQINSINQIRVQLQNKINSIEAKISGLEIYDDPENDDSMSVYLTAYQSTVSSIPNRIDRSTSLIDFYEFSFGRIGKTKHLYLNIWENYFNKDLSNAPSMIFSLLNNIIERIAIQVNQQLVNAETAEELHTIIDFYDKVRKYIESKNPTGNLDDNLLLREEVNQIIYLINLIITPAVRNILLNQIYIGLKELDGANSIIKDQNLILDEILTIEFNGQTLDSYLTQILPLSAVKYYSLIYNNSYDIDRKNISDVDLFMPIIQIIKSNKIIQIADDSLLIQNLREYLIPFFSNTYQNFIHHLRLSIYAYEKYLLNTYQLTKIMEQII